MTSRESPEYADWRRKVKQRDGKYCQWPGCNRIGRQVHHIIPYSSNVALRISVENGIHLCTKCHKRVKNKENDFVVMFMTIVEANTAKQQKRKKHEF